ncbi:MAG: hypothetical protein KDD42_04180 [Bdellovibrionales bacterium]|nr:hypothetical protein [Bdellovibrionales bacterium]
MTTDVGTILGISNPDDRSWHIATAIATKQLRVPTHVWQVFRAAWSGSCEPRDLVRVLGFSRLNPPCLLDAAELNNVPPPSETGVVEHAIHTLGIRFSAVVLAVNLANRCVLSAKPGRRWQPLFQDMMTNIEIGYKLGTRAYELGIEGGALVGFATKIGEAFLMIHDPKAYKEWSLLSRNGEYSDQEIEHELFGCESYQVTAIILQNLGFGTEVAIGIACGAGRLDPGHISISQEAIMWKAAYLWIEALRAARNYPADPRMRQVFPELIPSANGNTQGKNMALGVLHTEVARVRQEGSRWTWHLPKPSYEDTSSYLGI